MRLFSRKGDKDDKKKKCKYCDMVFDSDERLRRHIRKVMMKKIAICQTLILLEHDIIYIV